MRVARGATILLIAVLMVLGGPAARAGDDGAGDGDQLKQVDQHLGQAAQALVDAMKERIAAEDYEGVEELMDLLRAVMELRSRIGISTRTPAAEAPAEWKEPAAAVPFTEAQQQWFGGRGGRRNLRHNGGSAETAGAVDLALEWLSRHQGPDGAWDPVEFAAVCDQAECAGPGNKTHVTGTTALALLSFLADGHTPFHGAYRKSVALGLDRLLGMQDAEGCIGPRTTAHFTYSHALATQALAEAYALSRAPRLKEPAQRAVDFIHKAQNPYLGWRYGVRPGDNDTSVTTMMIAAMQAAKMAGLEVGQEAFDGAYAWIQKVTEPEYGRVGYTARGTGPARPQDRMDRFPADKSESLTAAGMLVRMYCGEDPRKSEMIQKGAHLCLLAPPAWSEGEGTIDFYYWYYGSQALFQVGGDSWKAWNKALNPALVTSQVKEGCARGSWKPVGAWCGEGGRVYSTAMGALCLQSYYRHGRIFDFEFRRR